jgi:hypothetical protein
MNRRRFLLAVTAFTLLSTTAARADYVEDIVKWLDRQGYTDIEVARTLLGRARIRAEKDGGQRELICNPRTGEILRDVWIDAKGNIRPASSSPDTGFDDRSNDDSGESNVGGSGQGDDDDGGDDNSGHGGGDDDEDNDNSGHGGSGDDDDDKGGDDDNSGHGGDDD